MDLRHRRRLPFTGFTLAEVQKMEQLFNESKEQALEEEFCKKLARGFNRSCGRAGKPAVKWNEIHIWFQKKQELLGEASLDASQNSLVVPYALSRKKADGNPIIGQNGDLSRLEFEARSSKDGAWYDVDTFLSHRFLSSNEIEVCLRFVGFGAEEDEWVNVRYVRERSVTLEPSECHKLKVGDVVLCFQEREDEAKYYDARVVEIQKKWHDIRGCRCHFLIRYIHDNFEETVQLRRLCCQPSKLAILK